MDPLIETLASVVDRHGDGAWLRAQLGQPGFAPAFAAAGRKLGTTPITDADAAAVCAAGLVWPAGTGADECGRAALVLAAVTTQPDPVAFVRDLIRRGEVRERCAVLRVLAALPEPARFVDLGVDACRTNVDGVFRAIACDNAFPARQFAAPAFDQMVLKALFVGAPLSRVVGLAERRTPELVRMVEAYASERRAAGRPVPDDAKLVTGP